MIKLLFFIVYDVLAKIFGQNMKTVPFMTLLDLVSGDTPDHPAVGGSADGSASEDFVAGSSSSRERKKEKAML
ncbi:hypothetical protein HAX54_020256 [Datura stramonium]|uniref:Uncharacterized protein n=1 Tax=Datura stramonium TaxID=4076 RepID=A0ABS8UQX5_DATST|nr:hypothetical protein [Datura stramonium]